MDYGSSLPRIKQATEKGKKAAVFTSMSNLEPINHSPPLSKSSSSPVLVQQSRRSSQAQYQSQNFEVATGSQDQSFSGSSAVSSTWLAKKALKIDRWAFDTGSIMERKHKIKIATKKFQTENLFQRTLHQVEEEGRDMSMNRKTALNYLKQRVKSKLRIFDGRVGDLRESFTNLDELIDEFDCNDVAYALKGCSEDKRKVHDSYLFNYDAYDANEDSRNILRPSDEVFAKLKLVKQKMEEMRQTVDLNLGDESDVELSHIQQLKQWQDLPSSRDTSRKEKSPYSTHRSSKRSRQGGKGTPMSFSQMRRQSVLQAMDKKRTQSQDKEFQVLFGYRKQSIAEAVVQWPKGAETAEVIANAPPSPVASNASAEQSTTLSDTTEVEQYDSDIEKDGPTTGTNYSDYFGVEAKQDFWDLFTSLQREENPSTPRRRFLRSLEDISATPQTVIIRNRVSQVFNMEHCGLGDKMVLALCQSFFTDFRAIQLLNLSDNNLTDRTVAEVIEVSRNLQSLQSIDLSQNIFGVRSAHQLASLLRVHKSLMDLHLSNVKLNDVSVTIIAEGMKSNKSVVRMNLSRNQISSIGARALGELLEVNSRIQELDLSWNWLRGAGASQIVQALLSNYGVRCLRLGWNGIRYEGCESWSEIFATNGVLQFVDLSHNKIGEPASLVLADGLKQSKCLTALHLSGNPIGPRGTRALLCAARVSPTLTTLALAGCQMEFEDTDIDHKPAGNIRSDNAHAQPYSGSNQQARSFVYKSEDPSGAYSLNLEDVYERAVFRDLSQRVIEHPQECIFQNIQPPMWIPSDKIEDLAKIPTSGQKMFEFVYTEPKPTLKAKISDRNWSCLQSTLLQCTRNGQMQVAQIMATEFFFTLKQRHAFLDILKTSNASNSQWKHEVIVELLCHAQKPENALDVFQLLSINERAGAGRSYVKFRACIEACVTGRFYLDLSDVYERGCLRQLLKMDETDVKRQEEDQSINLSQQSYRTCFRNVKLNMVPFQIPQGKWYPPKQGLIQFDFVPYTIPYSPEAQLVDSDTFSIMVAELKTATDTAEVLAESLWTRAEGRRKRSDMRVPKSPMKGEARVQQQEENFAAKMLLLSKWVRDLPLSCTQLRQLLDQFDSVLGRTEAVVMCFGNLVDLHEFGELVWSFATKQERHLLCERLGPLRCFNPLYPNGSWLLNMEHSDESKVLQLLVQLATAEGGHTMMCTLNGEPVTVENRWSSSPPTTGIFECTYTSEIDLTSWKDRLELTKSTFVGTYFANGLQELAETAEKEQEQLRATLQQRKEEEEAAAQASAQAAIAPIEDSAGDLDFDDM